jgi:dTDP-4-amino-4,6-dideoxygalactose transaminase
LQAPLPDAPATLCVQLPIAADGVARFLAERGIETRRWYLPPLTRHPPFAGALTIGPDGGPHLPVTDMLAERLLGLPFHTRLAEEDVARVVAALGDALRELRS